MSDAELQALVATALNERLRKAGFQSSESSADVVVRFPLPVDLRLFGVITVRCEEDGTWIFIQEDSVSISERTAFTADAHVQAMMNRETAPCR